MSGMPKRWQLKIVDKEKLKYEPLPEIPRCAGPVNGARLQGKVAIITGANSPLGIGRATALLFAEAGARALYLCDVFGDYLPAITADIERKFTGVDIHTRVFNAADEKGVQGVVDAAMKSYGKLDVFFANAGTATPHKHLKDISAEEFLESLRINTLSVFLAIRIAGKAMAGTGGGSIVATASVAGIAANAGSAPYSAGKAGVISLVKTGAFQWAGTGVRVNAVCPGLIETGMTEEVFEGARRRGTEGRIGQLNPLGRGGRAEEVGRVVLVLAGEEGGYVNGQAWGVDGGLSAGLPFVRGKLA